MRAALQGEQVLSREADQAVRRDFYRAHDIVVAVEDDAWSRRCLIEAMACGAFVVAGRCASDLIINGITGIVIDNERREIEAALAWCKADPDAVLDRRPGPPRRRWCAGTGPSSEITMPGSCGAAGARSRAPSETSRRGRR